MRIATWNLEGKWTLRHRHLAESLDADLLLLTEVPDRVAIAGMRVHLTQGEMQPGRRWAAVAARTPISPLPDPHGATALADVDGLRVASSVLPWRNCGNSFPWTGPDQGSRTIAAVTDIEAANPVIWGGDWNHELAGRIYAGSVAGRARILAALDLLGLDVATARAPHRLPGATSIDHVAVPSFWSVTSAERVSSIMEGIALSDHDAYVVNME
ncbi:MAG: endonuclease/exonuclease/phosphatase family protein [Marmoricola sp.]